MSLTVFERGRNALSQFLQTHIHEKRDTPKINGSFGGFIALVVCLILIIIISCAGVIYLLRDQKTFDEEHARRGRSRYQRSMDTNNAHKRSFIPKSLATLFSRAPTGSSQERSSAGQVKMKRGGGHGWIQAGSGDDWESDSGEARRHRMEQLHVREVPSPNFSSIQSARSIVPPSPVSRSTSNSTSSVRFDLHAVRGLAHHDGHFSPHSTLPNVHSQLSSPSYSPATSPSPLRTTSPEPIPSGVTLDDDSPQPTPSSHPSVFARTFPGGSKFIEDL